MEPNDSCDTVVSSRTEQIMKSGIAVLVLLLASVPSTSCAQSAPYYQSHFPPEEFRARWEKIFDKIGDNGLAIVQGVSQTSGFIMPRQTNEFYYLCGIETPHSYILLDGAT